jgi:pimeloyl-ACP methyl ester carboxylesterase
VAPFLRDQRPYQHLLTYDHETFGTGVEESGQELAQGLRQQCGFKEKDQVTVHVYAHSMGCLLSRCLVELSGGHSFVDGLVMAGPPNNGTTLATLGRGALFLSNALLNGLAGATPLAVLSWLIEQVREQGVGLADLAVRSPPHAKAERAGRAGQRAVPSPGRREHGRRESQSLGAAGGKSAGQHPRQRLRRAE